MEKPLKIDKFDFKMSAEPFKTQIEKQGFNIKPNFDFERFEKYRKYLNEMIIDKVMTKSDSIKVCTRMIRMLNDSILE